MPLEMKAEYTITLDAAALRFCLAHARRGTARGKLEAALTAGEYHAKGVYPTGGYRLTLSRAEAEGIRDVLSDLLLRDGIGGDGTINQTGLMIERLLDLFVCQE